MAEFVYTAVGPDGKKKKGHIEAKTKEMAVANLKQEKNTVLNIEEAGGLARKINFSFGKKVKSRDFSVFCHQFVSIIQAGVTIVEAFQMLGEQTENKALKFAIQQVHADISKGDPLAVAMRRRGGVFPSMLCNMVEAGEASGSLDKSFSRMAIQFEKDAQLESAVKKAVIYPIVLIVVLIGVIFAMMTFVIPSFMGMFEGLDTEMPAITMAIVHVSDFFVKFWWLILIGIVCLILGFRAFRASAGGKDILDRLALRIPVLGPIQQKKACAKLGRTLCTLLGAGVPMIDALDITAKSMDNNNYRNAMKDAKEQVARGVVLSRPLKTSGLFPPMVCHMTSIGEETGNIEAMLENVATYYEEDVQNATESMMALMEPLIIIVMAFVVGFLILAILSPMFTLYEALGQ